MNDIKPTETIDLSVYFSKDYLEQCDLPQRTTFQECVEKLKWGTYGKEGTDPLYYKKLKSLTSDHLLNILITQGQIGYLTKHAIKHILKERHGIGDE